MFEALYNVRDLGGHVTGEGMLTRFGQLFRADGVHRATPADLKTLQSWGVSVVVDLRTANEREGDGLLDEPGFEVKHLPVFDGLDAAAVEIDRTKDSYLEDLYVQIIDSRGDRIARIVTELAEASAPALFHCTAGKDRTGVIAALVLSVVGVPDASIAGDYARSHDAMTGLAAWYREHRGTTVGGHAPADDTSVAMSYLGARPEWILRMLDHVHTEYGSAYDYLAQVGVSPGAVHQLRAKLLNR